MMLLLTLWLCSFALSLLLTPVCRDLALRFRCVDRPDNGRKLHARPVPRIGGIPIMAACLPLVVLWRPVFPSVLLIFAAGLWDDLFGLRARKKLGVQAAAAALACLAGVSIGEQAWWSAPLTILWLVGCTNAFNLIDGVDGLACGLGLIAALTMLAAALVHGQYTLALAAAPVAGALCGFLPYNFHRASVFLGDSGSLSLGFLLGIYAVTWSNATNTLPGMAAPLVALSIPLLDTVLAVARRAIGGQPIFAADRRHIHHLMLDRGLSHRGVALLLCGICGFAAIWSILLAVAPGQYGSVMLAAFCAAAWAGVRRLGYPEFSLARARYRGEAGAQPRLLSQ